MKNLLRDLALMLVLVLTLSACGKKGSQSKRVGNNQGEHNNHGSPKKDDQQQEPEDLPATPGVLYRISRDCTYAEVFGYEGTATEVQIAKKYNGLPVKTIYEEAFDGNTIITSVIIPDSVTSIGECAFYYCPSLTDVYYTGGAEEWASISIGLDNDRLTNATIHYNYVPET